MQKKNKKILISVIIIIALLLLLILSKNIINIQNKNKQNLLGNTAQETEFGEPNVPIISAGMIPIKPYGDSFVITTKNDNDWYDYSQGKPAYIMLNDGYYKSELERGITEDQLASNNVGNDALVVQNVENNNPSIYMWVPRFAINSETNEIKYIPVGTQLEEYGKVANIFLYKIEDQTKLDLSLSGIWMGVDVIDNPQNTITEMNGEEGKYGFIANTKPRKMTSSDVNILKKYLKNSELVVQLGDLTNLNRIILEIINTNEQEPIKTKVLYDETTDKIKIEVTAHKNPIVRIEDINGNVLSTQSETALMDKHVDEATIIDNKGNRVIVNRFVFGAGNSEYHVKDAGTEILSTQSQRRTWYKRYDGLAIVGIYLYMYKGREWVLPLSISTIEEATYTRTSDGIPKNDARVVEYKGVEYYYYFAYGVPHHSGYINSDFPFISEEYDDANDDTYEYMDTVALYLLDKYYDVK